MDNLPATANKTEEHKLYTQWKTTQSKPAFQKLYTSMKPLLHRAAEKAAMGSHVPESAYQIWAAQSMLDALRTYKPGAGAALQTHIYNSVHQKAKRLNYMFQNIGHMPEPRAMKVGLYQSEYENMRADLGREPSSAELADRLNWSLKDVGTIQKELRKDLALDGGVEEHAIFEGSMDEDILDSLYYELNPEEQLVYDYLYGKHGRPRMVKANKKVDFDGIGARTGFSPSKVRAVIVRLRPKLKKALQR